MKHSCSHHDPCDDNHSNDNEHADFEFSMNLMREWTKAKDDLHEQIVQLQGRLLCESDKSVYPILVSKLFEYASMQEAFGETEEQYITLLETVQLLRGCKPEDMTIALRHSLTDALFQLGIWHNDQEDWDEALDYYQASREEAEELVAMGDSKARIDLAGLLLNESAIYTQRNELEKAQSLVLQSIDRLRALVAEEFSDPETDHHARATLADALMLRSEQFLDQGDDHNELALNTASEAVDIFRQLRDDGESEYLGKLGSAILYVYELGMDRRTRLESIDLLNEAIDALTQAQEEDDVDVIQDLDEAYTELQQLLSEEKES